MTEQRPPREIENPIIGDGKKKSLKIFMHRVVSNFYHPIMRMCSRKIDEEP